MADVCKTIDASGKVVLPGLVDCHTHSVWAGSRSDEWERRLGGESYVSILEGGGGINSTVRATRSASQASLEASARLRVLGMRNNSGVTSVEIKSGYGLSVDAEEKMLLAARSCVKSGEEMRVFTTFLGAHTIPDEYRPGGCLQEQGRDGYVAQVVEEQLPRCAPLCDYVDVFCDRGAFTLEEARVVLEAGKRLGLKVRAHAEQIESTGCARLVAQLGGVSADHLEQLDSEGAAAMGAGNVVAVLLPGAQLYLKDVSPPVPLLREHGVRMAIASDLNPGSSPVHNLWTVASLACILQGCTVSEALLGITKHGGLALDRPELGWLGVGDSVGDCVILDSPPGEPATVASLLQHIGTPRVSHVIVNGKLVFSN